MSHTEQILPQTELSPETVIDLISQREAWLHSILGTDYEHAVDLKLIEQFDYHPENSQDALKHVLAGDVFDGGNGRVLASGFHHEPSAQDGTYVDRAHLKAEGVTSKSRQKYAEKPFEPYRAKTTILGSEKNRLVASPDGILQVAPEQSSMFPKEYDALAVIKTIVGARDARDKTKDVLQPNGTIAAEGYWTMVDDHTMMRLNIILDPQNERIITAMPRVRSYMNLTPGMIDASLGLT